MVRVDISSKEYRPFTFHQDYRITTRYRHAEFILLVIFIVLKVIATSWSASSMQTEPEINSG